MFLKVLSHYLMSNAILSYSSQWRNPLQSISWKPSPCSKTASPCQNQVCTAQIGPLLRFHLSMFNILLLVSHSAAQCSGLVLLKSNVILIISDGYITISLNNLTSIQDIIIIASSCLAILLSAST